MQLVIPSSGRANKQTTLRYMPKAVQKRVSLVVQQGEREAYKRALPDFPGQILTLPEHITTISPTRQWIFENTTDRYMCIIDDDLRFYVRGREDNPLYLRYLDGEDEFNQMFADMENFLINGGAHAGISAREGNNRKPNPVYYNERMMRCCAYDLQTFQNEGIRSDRIPLKSDFDITLQLLRKGYMNRVSYHYAQGQVGGSNAKGGCSRFRTMKLLETSAHDLEAYHPDFVNVVEKETKAAWWGGGVRTDVRIQWKKAYESSQS